jgi:hypothetical protein
MVEGMERRPGSVWNTSASVVSVIAAADSAGSTRAWSMDEDCFFFVAIVLTHVLFIHISLLMVQKVITATFKHCYYKTSLIYLGT